MKDKNKENNNNLTKENEPQKEIMDSLRNIKLLNEKMFLST